MDLQATELNPLLPLTESLSTVIRTNEISTNETEPRTRHDISKLSFTDTPNDLLLDSTSKLSVSSQDCVSVNTDISASAFFLTQDQDVFDGMRVTYAQEDLSLLRSLAFQIYGDEDGFSEIISEVLNHTSKRVFNFDALVHSDIRPLLQIIADIHHTPIHLRKSVENGTTEIITPLQSWSVYETGQPLLLLECKPLFYASLTIQKRIDDHESTIGDSEDADIHETIAKSIREAQVWSDTDEQERNLILQGPGSVDEDYFLEPDSKNDLRIEVKALTNLGRRVSASHYSPCFARKFGSEGSGRE